MVRSGNDIGFVIDNAFKLKVRDIEKLGYLPGFEEPDMNDRHCKVYMAHTFSSYPGMCDLNTTSITHYPLVTYSFVLSTTAFPVPNGTENAFTEKPFCFRFVTSVINGFGLTDLSMGPFPYSLRGSKTYLHTSEVGEQYSGITSGNIL